METYPEWKADRTVPTGPEPPPIQMLLWCPTCHERHIDVGEFAHKSHHTHACQHCGMVWRPAREATVGVQFLPGFRDESMAGTYREAMASDLAKWGKTP